MVWINMSSMALPQNFSVRLVRAVSFRDPSKYVSLVNLSCSPECQREGRVTLREVRHWWGIAAFIFLSTVRHGDVITTTLPTV